MLSAWDVRLAARSAGVAIVLTVSAWAITALTDEGGQGVALRLSRTLPAVPPCVAMGAWLALRSPYAQGEGLAMACLGRSPLGVVAGAVVGASLVAMVAALALAWGNDAWAAAFFPVVVSPHTWVTEGESFVDLRGGYAITPDGGVQWRVPSRLAEAVGLPHGARTFSAISLALASIGGALLAATPPRAQAGGRRLPDLAICVAVLAGAILTFHAVAARRLAPFWVLLPSATLLAWAFLRYKAPRWIKAAWKR